MGFEEGKLLGDDEGMSEGEGEGLEVGRSSCVQQIPCPHTPLPLSAVVTAHCLELITS